MIKRNRRVKGGSIIEVVTGLIIISLSLALTGVLFSNVFDTSNRYHKWQAWYVVNEWVNTTRMNKVVEAEEKVFDNYTISKTTRFLDEQSNLWQITISATDKTGEQIVLRRFLLEVNENE